MFIYYTIADLASTSGKSEMTVKNALTALEQKNLISRKRQGAGLPSKIYVQVQTENCPTGWTTFKPQTDKKLSTSNKQRKTKEKASHRKITPFSRLKSREKSKILEDFYENRTY